MGTIEITERWHEVCYFLCKSISPNISEELFEQKVFQVLEKMGWSSFRKEIQPKQSIQVGTNNWIIPDIIVKSIEKKFQFVVEVKKPSANLEDSSHKNQLFSYMRMLKSEYGLLIGNNIKIYYDGILSNSEFPVLLSQIQFDEDSEEGIKFIELFSKDTYSENQIKLFVEKVLVKIQAKENYKKILNLITSKEYTEMVKRLIKNDLNEKFDDEVITNSLKDVIVKIITPQIPFSDIQNIVRTERQFGKKPVDVLSESSKTGVIASIKNLITSNPKTQEEILDELVQLFPDRSPESMRNTIKAQLGGGNPLRMEKERNIQINISIGSDNIKRYSCSKSTNDSRENHKLIEAHIFKSYQMNKDEFTTYLADKYITDDQQKEIFLSKDVWLKVKLNYIAGLILTQNGKVVFSPKDIRELLSSIIPSLSEISDNQLSGCLLTQDVCVDAPDPK